MSMEIVTAVSYRKGSIDPHDPQGTMRKLFDALRGSGYVTTGSFTHFQAEDPVNGDTFVFDVQDKRTVT